MNKEKIIAHFGADFYVKVLDKLKKYAELWNLADFEQIEHYTWNCLFKCVSDKHGLCVLKIGDNPKSAELEWRVLSEYNGRRFCKLYEADTANGVLLVECIMPGTQLQDEPDLDKRIDIFCEILNGFHIKPADKDSCTSYMTYVNNITEYMSTRKDYNDLYAKMLKAQEIYRRLCEKYPDEVLLHNDLSHYNILSDGNNGSINSYRIIDPREAVTGVAVFDIPYFILYEYDNRNADKILYITSTISKKLNIPARDIWSAAYVDDCINVCYSVKYGGEPNINSILLAERLMDEMV